MFELNDTRTVLLGFQSHPAALQTESRRSVISTADRNDGRLPADGNYHCSPDVTKELRQEVSATETLIHQGQVILLRGSSNVRGYKDAGKLMKKCLKTERL